jgi:hypothetical protein
LAADARESNKDNEDFPVYPIQKVLIKKNGSGFLEAGQDEEAYYKKIVVPEPIMAVFGRDGNKMQESDGNHESYSILKSDSKDKSEASD